MQYDDIELEKIDAFVDLNDKRVLEIGCGDGRLSSFLVRKAGHLTAVDIEITSLEEARRKVTGVDFRLGSGESLDFPDRSFDLVFFGYSLHHQNGLAALTEALRVLVPGGEILIIEPTETSEYTKLVSVFEKDEPAMLRRATQDIVKFGKVVCRRENFVVNHYFENTESFFDHYISSYGSGTADERSYQKMQQIIGDKFYESPIRVEDECNIILIRA